MNTLMSKGDQEVFNQLHLGLSDRALSGKIGRPVQSVRQSNLRLRRLLNVNQVQLERESWLQHLELHDHLAAAYVVGRLLKVMPHETGFIQKIAARCGVNG